MKTIIRDLKCLLAFAFSISFDCKAVDVAIPRPEDMLKEADFVAVVSLRKTMEQWELIPSEVLKGSRQVSKAIQIQCLFPPAVLTIDELDELTKGKPFLFVGAEVPNGNAVHPKFWRCSAWPDGMSPATLKPRTVGECVEFAKRTIGKPEGIASPPTEKGTVQQLQDRKPVEQIGPGLSNASLAPLPVITKKVVASMPASVEKEETSLFGPWGLIGVLVMLAVGLLCLFRQRS